jgi:hypothetical protein
MHNWWTGHIRRDASSTTHGLIKAVVKQIIDKVLME